MHGSGAPEELLPLPPDCVSPVLDTRGALWYAFTHPESGERTLLRREDVLHYKAYSEDGIEGVSVLKRASLTLSTAQAAARYENSTWNSGGQPSGILTTDADLGRWAERKNDAGETVWVDPKEELRQSWERVHRGPDRAFRVAVLDLGLKYQPISMTNTDAQFVESSEIRVADVCRFFGVPLPSERAKHQRIKRELKVFLQGDTAAQAAWLRTQREIGAYSVNEIRALGDLPAVAGGDNRYASLNYVPLETWGS